MMIKFISWDFTPELIKEQITLLDCFKDVANKNPKLHTFLMQECGHLLELQQSSVSNIPVNLLTPPIANLVDLGNNFSTTKIKSCKSMSGCYAYLNIQGEVIYIGSNVDYFSRMKNHYSSLKDLNYAFYNKVNQVGGFQHFKWVPLLAFENYAIKYQKLGNVLSAYDFEAIKLVTQFQVRCVEQALISYYNPKCNSYKSVQFPNFWYYGPKDDEDTVKVINVAGSIFNFTSVAKASLFTGVSTNHIRDVCNCTTPIYAFSPIMEEDVHFLVKYRPTIEPKDKARRQLKGFDLSILPERMVSILDNKKEWLGMSYIYGDPKQAKDKLDIQYNGNLAKLVNMDEMVFSSVLDAKVHLVTKDKSLQYIGVPTRGMKVTNLLTNEVHIYTRKTDLYRTLKIAPKTVLKYMKNKQAYDGKYMFEDVE